MYDRDKIFNEAVEVAFHKLPPEQQELLDQMVQVLIKKYKNMGVLSAMELLAKIGILSHNREEELTKLLDIVEKESIGEKKAWRRKQLLYSKKKLEL